MAIVERPNQEALSRAINLYLDAFRPSLTRNLKQVSAKTLEDAILQSLPRDKAEHFAQHLPETVDPESSIEVGHIEFILSHYWNEAFALPLRNRDSVFVKVRCVSVARNQVSHPAYRRDLDRMETLKYLDALVYLLRAVGASEEREAVANIKAGLENQGERAQKATDDFDRLEEQYQKTVDELGETRGFLWKAEIDLDEANSRLEREVTARRKAERAAQVAEILLCQTIEVLDKEVACRMGAETLATNKSRARQMTEQATQHGRRVLNEAVRHVGVAMARLVKSKRRAMFVKRHTSRVMPSHNAL